MLSKIHWDLVIIDEAHKLKNYDSKFTSTMREEYVYEHVVLLTGTLMYLSYSSSVLYL